MTTAVASFAREQHRKFIAHLTRRENYELQKKPFPQQLLAKTSQSSRNRANAAQKLRNETPTHYACRPHHTLNTDLIRPKGGEIRDTKTFNLSRNIVSLQVLVDVSRFSPCVINLTRNKNICCGLKKCRARIG